MLLETKSVKSNLHKPTIKKVPPSSGIFYVPSVVQGTEKLARKFTSLPNYRVPFFLRACEQKEWATASPTLSDSALIGITIKIAIRYYHMVNHPNIHQFARLAHLTCQIIIFSAWSCTSARVVVYQCQSSRTTQKSLFHHYPNIYHCTCQPTF